ncbi:MAG TPA: hypothetical protein VES68_01635, partial [Candidatus Sulfotelmatobacter sp.]|nr:hypothetical protein [Candidatus Sulfotelmatobacter sp.]
YTAKKNGLKNDFSLVFAVTISSLHTIVRWINTQIIDIWLAVFFLISLSLFQKPVKKISYFIFLGAACGILIGSKYTGVYFLFILLLFNFKKIIKVLSLQRLVAFLIPFTILGLMWYLRNYLLTQNPIYPQAFLFFKGANNSMLSNNVYRSLSYPNGLNNFLNAFFSEYFIFSFALLVPIAFLFKKFRQKKINKAKTLITIGFLNLLVFFSLPSDRYDYIAVSVIRYTYPSIIPIILGIFIIAKEYKKEVLLSFFSLSSFIIVPELSFYPKLLFLFVPLALLIFYFEETFLFMKNKVHLKGGK